MRKNLLKLGNAKGSCREYTCSVYRQWYAGEKVSS